MEDIGPGWKINLGTLPVNIIRIHTLEPAFLFKGLCFDMT